MIKKNTFTNSNQAKTMAMIVNEVSTYYDIDKSKILSPSRIREYAEPRQVIMFIAKKITSYSLATIGTYFEGKNGRKKDHATVLHATKAIQNLIDTDKAKSKQIEYILNRCIKSVANNSISTNDQTIIVDSKLGKFITFTGFSQYEIDKIQEVFKN